MATVTLKGSEIHTLDNLPEVGSIAPDFNLTRADLSQASLHDFRGKNLVLNIFHSIDTGTCAQSVKAFNKAASDFDNTIVLCISKDLPFAQSRFCGAEGIENVVMLSDFRDGNFGKAYGLTYTDGPIASLLSRSVIVLDTHGKVLYTQQVQEVVEAPDYTEALKALANA